MDRARKAFVALLEQERLSTSGLEAALADARRVMRADGPEQLVLFEIERLISVVFPRWKDESERLKAEAYGTADTEPPPQGFKP